MFNNMEILFARQAYRSYILNNQHTEQVINVIFLPDLLKIAIGIKTVL